MNWRTREQHPAEFTDGETMLVAVPVVDTRFGTACKRPGNRWELSVASVECSEGWIRIVTDSGPWWWDWSDVEYWLPISEVKEGLPAL